MTIPFSPCKDPTAPFSECTDTTVHILHKIFGDVVPALVAGADPATVDKSTNIIASMLYVFNNGVLIVGSIIVGYVIIVGMVSTASDGEALGKNWSTIFTPLRTVVGAAILLPTDSGYSFIQHFVMMLAMWAIGFANSIHSTGMKTGVELQGLGPKHMLSSSANASNKFGLRAFANAYLPIAHCKKAINTASVHTGYWLWQSDTPAKIQAVLQGNKMPYEQVQVRSGMDGAIVDEGKYRYVFNFVDVNPQTSLAGGEPVCGTVSITAYRLDLPSNAANETKEIIAALQTLQRRTNEVKILAINYIVKEIDKWVQGWPNSISDGNWEIDTRRLNDIVTQANLFVAGSLASTLESAGSASSGGMQAAADRLFDGMLSKGWSHAGGWHQRVAQVGGWIRNAMESTPYEVTPPNLQELPNDEAARMFKLAHAPEGPVYKAVRKAEDHFSATPGKKDNNIFDIYSAISIGKSLDTSIQTTVTSIIHREVNKLERSIVDIATGSGKDQGATFIGCGNIGKIGGSINRMKCIGEYAAIANTTVKGGFETLKLGTNVMAVGVGTTVVGRGAQEGIYRLIEQLDAVITKPLAEYTGIIAFQFGVLIPSLPYVIFIVVVVAWLLEVALAIVATPLWAVMLMTSERSFIGSQKQGVLMLLSIFIRPALAIIGLFLALIVSDPIITYLADAFFVMRGAITGSSDSIVGAVAELTGCSKIPRHLR